MTPKETLNNFLESLKVENITYEDVIKHLTMTQQEESKFVGRTNVHAHINGMYELVKNTKEFKIKEKFTTNQLAKDCIITFVGKNKVRMQCRLVKESGLRKPDKNGTWGVNVSSFKLLKPKS